MAEERGFDFGRTPMISALVGAAVAVLAVLVFDDSTGPLSLLTGSPLPTLVEAVLAGGIAGALFGTILALGWIGE